MAIISNGTTIVDNGTLQVSGFDDNKIVNDISTLALRQATQENLVNYNTTHLQ